MECKICHCEVAKTTELLLEHIGRVHSHSAGFQISCIIAGCQRTYKNYSAFRKHLREAHKYYSRQPISTNQLPSTSYDECQLNYIDDSSDEHILEPPTKKQRAEWILKIRETNKITQACTENILSVVTSLCSSMVHDLTEAVKQKLTSHNATPELHQDIMEVFQTPNFSKPFEGLETHYKQMQYLKECFDFVVRHYLVNLYSLLNFKAK